MDDAMIELGRRAVACERWEWMPGMLVYNPWKPDLTKLTMYSHRVLDGRHYHTIDGIMHDDWVALKPDNIPDLTDDATIGCLMGLVRRAYDGAVVITRGKGWWSVETDHALSSTGSFAEALVWALEAAS